ncbi:MAG: phenylacetate--CoA ligase family protein [bacterium]|nr:phenylacetate--CoA ligase family protein [bacterium]
MSESSWIRHYAKLPVVLQNLACTLAGIKMRRTRHNRVFRDAMRFLDESQWWTAERQREYQDDQLRRTIRHAYETVPYYREVFEQRGLRPDDIRTADDLPKLPILEKQTVRDRFDDLQSRGWPTRRQVHLATGGTTGTCLHLIEDMDTAPWRWAVQWRHRRRFGVEFGRPFVVFASKGVVPLSNMNPPIWRRNLVMHQTYVSVHHMTKQNMPALVEYLQKRRLEYYAGFPSALYLLATHLLDDRASLGQPPKMVYTGSETLLPHQRSAIQQALGADVGDHYTPSEACAFISECEQHSYHVDTEYGVVELLPLDGGPVDLRRIVGTGFCNPAMPLIRYNTGDLATVSGGDCSCGRATPIVEKIDGRTDSYIVTPDGRQLGRLSTIFKRTPAIAEAQLVQDTLEHVTVKVVRSDTYTQEDDDRFREDLRRYLGDVILIDVEYLDQIPREDNGKFRQIVSKVFRDRYKEAENAGSNT